TGFPPSRERQDGRFQLKRPFHPNGRSTPNAPKPKWPFQRNDRFSANRRSTRNERSLLRSGLSGEVGDFALLAAGVARGAALVAGGELHHVLVAGGEAVHRLRGARRCADRLGTGGRTRPRKEVAGAEAEAERDVDERERAARQAKLEARREAARHELVVGDVRDGGGDGGVARRASA